MKWYEKIGYRIIQTKKAGWIIKSSEWWIGGFNSFEEAENYIDYLW